MGNRKGSKRGPYKHHQPPRMCKYPGCGIIYIPENSNQKYCKNPHYAKCKVCGKSILIKDMTHIPNTCSRECSMELAKRTSEERYGDRNYIHSKEVRERVKQTNLARRGVPYPMQSADVKKKRDENNLKKWGATIPTATEKGKALVKAACQAKYGVDWPTLLPQVIGKHKAVSAINQHLAWYLHRIGLDYEMEYRVGSYIYDFHVRNTNVLIEVNPTVTHNAYFNPWGKPIGPDYHAKKFDNAWDHGYICIHIYDWMNLDYTVGYYLLFSEAFKTSEVSNPVLHWVREHPFSHIVDDGTQDYAQMIEDKYLPVYDDGRNLEFIIKELNTIG